MKYQILQSSSKGNAFLFENHILLDTGISWKKLNELCDTSLIDYVLLTHEHGDHFNLNTIQKLYVHTDCKFLCGEWLFEKMKLYEDRTKIIHHQQVYGLKGIKMSPFNLYHDVPNFGYRFMSNTHRHFHATDTFSLDGIDAYSYDSATIEANHETNKALRIIEQAKEDGTFSHLIGAMNSHLSVEKTINFLRENNIKKFDIVHVGSSTEKEVWEKINDFKLEKK